MRRNKKVKVLHLITLGVVGGSQDNTFSTAERHDRRRFEVHLACNPAGAWVERAKKSADFFHPLPTLVTPVKPLQDVKAFIHLVRLLRREQFDLVHTHTAKAGFVGRLAASICRVPCVVHTYHALPFHAFMPAWKRWFYVSLERLACSWTVFFITVSENTREEGLARRVLDEGRSRTIYSGIDFTKLDAATNPIISKEKLNIPQSWQIVLMAGRLEPQKAPQLLIEAFSQVVKNCPQTALLIAGDGPLRPSLERRIAALGLEPHVRLLGYREDVPDLIRLADVFAISSLWEGMGRAMVEAMLLGKPVVAPAIYGIPEVVHHGKTGLLYDVGCVEQLAAGITQLLVNRDEARRIGYNARQLTRNLFDVNVMVARIEQIYEKLLDRKPAVAPGRSLRRIDPFEPAAVSQRNDS